MRRYSQFLQMKLYFWRVPRLSHLDVWRLRSLQEENRVDDYA
jgi:hypothetical protein